MYIEVVELLNVLIVVYRGGGTAESMDGCVWRWWNCRKYERMSIELVERLRGLMEVYRGGETAEYTDGYV